MAGIFRYAESACRTAAPYVRVSSRTVTGDGEHATPVYPAHAMHVEGFQTDRLGFAYDPERLLVLVVVELVACLGIETCEYG